MVMLPSGITRQHRPQRHRIWVQAIAAFALGLLVAACGATRYSYSGSSSLNTYFRVPTGWTPYNESDLLHAAGLDTDPAQVARFKFLVGYDSASNASLLHVLDTQQAPSEPVVIAWVQQLSPQRRDQISLGDIRNALYPIDAHNQVDTGNVVSFKDLTFPGGFHGSTATYIITGPAPKANSSPQPVEVSQAGVFDSNERLFYFISVRCSPTCFQRNRTTIDQIVSSWNVKEH